MLLMLISWFKYCVQYCYFFFKIFDKNFLKDINIIELSFFENFMRTNSEQFLFVEVAIVIMFISLFCCVCGLGSVLINQFNYFWNLLSLEIVYVSAAIFFIGIGQYFNLAFFYICSIIIITFSGIDAALGLVILVKMYKMQHTLDFDRPFIF